MDHRSMPRLAKPAVLFAKESKRATTTFLRLLFPTMPDVWNTAPHGFRAEQRKSLRFGFGQHTVRDQIRPEVGAFDGAC